MFTIKEIHSHLVSENIFGDLGLNNIIIDLGDNIYVAIFHNDNYDIRMNIHFDKKIISTISSFGDLVENIRNIYYLIGGK